MFPNQTRFNMNSEHVNVTKEANRKLKHLKQNKKIRQLWLQGRGGFLGLRQVYSQMEKKEIEVIVVRLVVVN